MTTPTLETPRLRMEPVTPAHAPSLQEHFAHWAVIRRLSTAVPWPYPPDGVETFLRDTLLPAVAEGRAQAWALVPKGAGGAVGMLEWRTAPDARDHRGFWLGEAWWGRGLMTEAVTRFQDYVFLELGIERLVVHNAVVNAASRRVKEKTGARLLGEVSIPHHEGVHLTQQWEVTREAWIALRHGG